MESSRFLTIPLLPGFQPSSRKGQTLMVLSIDYSIQPELYTLSALSPSFPYKTANWVSSIGQSSFVVTQIIFQEDRRKPLVETRGTYVNVDWNTRRPHPLPSEFKNSIPIQETETRRKELPKVPSEKYCYEAEIQPSDIDNNLHTNQSVYIRLCSNAAASAEAYSYYRGIHDVQNQPLSEMWTFYNGESVEGDKLTVCTWQSPKNVDIIYFAIEKESTPIFYCRWKLGKIPKSSL